MSEHRLPAHVLIVITYCYNYKYIIATRTKKKRYMKRNREAKCGSSGKRVTWDEGMRGNIDVGSRRTGVNKQGTQPNVRIIH